MLTTEPTPNDTTPNDTTLADTTLNDTTLADTTPADTTPNATTQVPPLTVAQKVGIAVGVGAPASMGLCALIWTYCGDILDCMPTIFTGGDDEEDEEDEDDSDAEEERQGTAPGGQVAEV